MRSVRTTCALACVGLAVLLGGCSLATAVDRDEIVVTISVAVPDLDEQASDADLAEVRRLGFEPRLVDGKLVPLEDETADIGGKFELIKFPGKRIVLGKPAAQFWMALGNQLFGNISHARTGGAAHPFEAG